MFGKKCYSIYIREEIMKLKRFLNIISVLLVIVFALTSCKEEDGSGYTFKMNIENNPSNLDPQMAEDSSSLMIISNMMEGLVRISDTGGIVPAAAENFEMSGNGLVYTFHLRQDRMWESESDFTANVTAGDFVFAFRRIFDPETDSPYSSDYMCIKNGGAVLNGALPVESLGVRALDDFTVEFTLEYPYFDFLTLLAKPAAMPCCKDFFALSKGRYGMAADATASNGAFYIKEWNYDPYWDNNYIIMRRNKSYSESSFVYPYSLNFFITGDSSIDAENYAEGDIDCYVSHTVDEKTLSANKNISAETKTAGLVFNPRSKYFGSKVFREALAKSVNREAYSHELPAGMSAAFGIVPSGINIQGKSYRDIIPDRTLSVYDAGAAQIWENALKAAGLDSVDNVKITVPDSFAGSDIIYNMTERWQNELLFNCRVEIVSQNEYETKISEGTYDIALIEVGCDENSAYKFMKFFSEDRMFSGYANSGLMTAVNGIKTADSLSAGAERIKSAETAVITDYSFIPLCYESEYLIFGEEVSDIVFYPYSETAYFGNAKNFD